MSNNNSMNNFSAQASINDYEYISNFRLGSFENKSQFIRMFEGVEFCMKMTSKDNKFNEEKFKNCYSLRKQMLEKADKVDMLLY